MTAFDALIGDDLGACPIRSTRERADAVGLMARLGKAARSTLELLTFLLVALAPMLLAGAIGFFGNGV